MGQTFGEKLRALRVARGLTQEQLGTMIGSYKQVISRYENAQRSPKISVVAALAAALDARFFFADDEIEFMANTQPAYRPAPPPPPPRVHTLRDSGFRNTQRIPILGRVPAGIPVEAIEEVDDYEEIGGDLIRGGFEYVGLRVRGDSMRPTYLDGDMLIVRLQNTADSGDDAVVFVGTDDATFKRISRSQKGLSLRPLNPEYEPMFFSNREIQELPVTVFGVCVEFRRRVKR